MNDALDAALASVPRAPFARGPVPRSDAVGSAIGRGSRGTPPDTLARMLRVVEVREAQRVLELGAGTGYATAVLATLGAQVHAVERDSGLAAHALRALAELGLSASVHCADGLLGWPEAAPYDVVFAGFSVQRLPPSWLAQLSDSGALIAPVGPAEGRQELTLWRRQAGQLSRRSLGPARFAPAEPGLSPGS